MDPLKRLETLYDELGNYEAVARLHDDCVTRAHIWQIINNGYIPRDRKIRRALGFTDSRAAVTVRDNDTGLVLRFRMLAAELGMSNQELGLEAIRAFLFITERLDEI